MRPNCAHNAPILPIPDKTYKVEEKNALGAKLAHKRDDRKRGFSRAIRDICPDGKTLEFGIKSRGPFYLVV